jgi:hypothetical protein
LRPSNHQLMPWNFQIQYNYLLIELSTTLSYLCYLYLVTYSGIHLDFTMWVIWRVSNKKQELLTFLEHLGSHLVYFLWVLCIDSVKECRVAIFHDKLLMLILMLQWWFQGSLFSWITLWNLYRTLKRCKVAYFHGKRHDPYSIQWCQVANFHNKLRK